MRMGRINIEFTEADSGLMFGIYIPYYYKSWSFKFRFGKYGFRVDIDKVKTK